MTKHKFPYNWTLADAVFTKDKGKVFSCFACGGGSTMGYKLAGFDVLGCNEIDPRMAECYITNHKPKYAFIQPIQEFKLREDLPADLYDLDILDGSPPCSSFSMAGNREKDWGKEKHFREGQAKQVLDTLFFDFIELAQKLKPKIVIAENVKGMLIGKAKAYTKKVYEAFDAAGYYVRIYLFNAAKMGVPQRRERIFFIALRKDIADANADIKKDKNGAPILEFGFNEPEILFSEIEDKNDKSEAITETQKKHWINTPKGNCFSKFHEKGHWFNSYKIQPNEVCPTVLAGTGNAGIYHYEYARKLNILEYSFCSTFPTDYKYCKNKPKYLMGMSVPPIMTAQIATKIYEQWLSKINK
jgi:DNA (cytosine-5)-methyltransferase 1